MVSENVDRCGVSRVFFPSLDTTFTQQKIDTVNSTESISPVTESDLRSVVSSSPVVFLFLHGQETLSVEDSVRLSLFHAFFRVYPTHSTITMLRH